ncbi:DnaD domain protein [Staphylococcus epidermidis]|uniref:DnaD domain protein n=1 Tax=Staphylococcus epidermidis TaxID=1282 RepID=A0A8X8G6T8_STAEP|nr:MULTISPECIES: DnaD domain protein [Staphylococcus]EJE30583.1 DnaD domain protein [Staphylococcus epidermidis NIH04008]KAB2170473.1 DnaD domain protein [Staphylococcus epidermidis]KAB2178003.1 DnaD domain protein [Staphylococcus epidermidis]KAB2199027.1 DnaD domain protein [Staphylococcus epidermidis]KAB2202287.1 DnaD domain protein [Staphylococcus epidermidis]
MATFRTIKESGDFVTVHKAFVFDNKLSAKAKGILLYFLSRPDNWQIYTSEVVKHMNDGQKSINSGIQELIKSKYVHRIQKRTDNGVFNGYEYLVYEKPTEMPFSANGLSANGKTENRKGQTTNNNSTNNDLTNNKNTNNVTDETSKLFQYISNNLEIIQNPLKAQQLEEAIKDFKDNKLEIVTVATDYCKENNKGINYLIKVLENWNKDGVNTKEKAISKVKPRNNKEDDYLAKKKQELLGG